MLYVATVRKPTKHFLHKAKVAFSKATLNRPFIHSDHIQTILAQTKIVPGLDLSINIEAQTLGLGLKHALGFGQLPNTMNSRITNLLKDWNNVRQSKGVESCDPLKEILAISIHGEPGLGAINKLEIAGKGITYIKKTIND